MELVIIKRVLKPEGTCIIVKRILILTSVCLTGAGVQLLPSQWLSHLLSGLGGNSRGTRGCEFTSCSVAFALLAFVSYCSYFTNSPLFFLQSCSWIPFFRFLLIPILSQEAPKLFNKEDFLPLDPTQELIFPPELIVSFFFVFTFFSSSTLKRSDLKQRVKTHQHPSDYEERGGATAR